MKVSDDINFPILTEVVWGLGKLRNEKSIPPITELQTKVWLIYDTSKEMEERGDAGKTSPHRCKDQKKEAINRPFVIC